MAFCNHHSDLLFCVPHLILKNLWLRLATQILQNSLAHHPVGWLRPWLSICNFNSPLPCDLTCSKFPGNSTWMRLVEGAFFCLPQDPSIFPAVITMAGPHRLQGWCPGLLLLVSEGVWDHWASSLLESLLPGARPSFFSGLVPQVQASLCLSVSSSSNPGQSRHRPLMEAIVTVSQVICIHFEPSQLLTAKLSPHYINIPLSSICWNTNWFMFSCPPLKPNPAMVELPPGHPPCTGTQHPHTSWDTQNAFLAPITIHVLLFWCGICPRADSWVRSNWLIPREFLILGKTPWGAKERGRGGSHTLTLHKKRPVVSRALKSFHRQHLLQPQLIQGGGKRSPSIHSVRCYSIQGGEWGRLTGNQRSIGSVWVSGWWNKVNFRCASAWKRMWGLESGGCEGRPWGQNDISSGKALGCEVRQSRV